MTLRRASIVYLLVGLVGTAAFLYPFWLPAESGPASAHAGVAPLIAAAIGALVLVAVAVEIRTGELSGTNVAILGVLSALAGLLRLVDLPGGGSGMFFLVILAGAAFGPRFGLLLGIFSMAVSALLTGGVGPWLPFQMLALAAMGAASGLAGTLTGRLGRQVEIVILAAFGWAWGFIYGAIMNIWFWPFVRDGGPLSWEPGLGLMATLHRYWSFYLTTSFAWDAAGAIANAILILLIGMPVLATLRRFASRMKPVVEATPASPASPHLA
ncbi:MAG: ECF transporter S component [Acidobacteria bacterium]|nr:MAG: ECF transporter S component [Acidobacteriota bacterium]